MIYPVCPHCSASDKNDAAFIAIEVHSDEAPRRGSLMESMLQFVCMACSEHFPFWTYRVGDVDSLLVNAVDETDQPWRDPDWDNPPFWAPEPLKSTDELTIIEVAR